MVTDVQLKYSSLVLDEEKLIKMAKKVCNGHQHAKRYHQMLKACMGMSSLVLEELHRQNKIINITPNKK
jgi:hypothetical protein